MFLTTILDKLNNWVSKHIQKIVILAILLIACNSFHIKVVNNHQPRFGQIAIAFDQEFTDDERILMAVALRAWERAGNNNFKFKPIWHQKKPTRYRDYQLDINSGIFIWKFNKDDRTQLDKTTAKRYASFHALYEPGPGKNSANILVFIKSEPSMIHFYGVFLHEIGHLLGLKHIPKSGALMHPTENTYCISKTDAENLCAIYNCYPKPDC